MATTWKAPTWRMLNEKNQNKFESYSLDFDGTESINCGSATAYDKFTLSVWVKKDSLAPNYAGIFGSRNGSSTTFIYLLGLDNTGKFRFIADGSTNILSDNVISNDVWYHVVGIADGTTMKMYINGQLQSSTASYSTPLPVPNNNLMIGKQWDTDTQYRWVGEISQCCLFDYALSESQIASLYNSGSPINPMTLKPAPIAYYPLGGNASTGGDSSNTLSVPNVAVPDASVFDFSTSDVVESPHISIDSSFTVSAWVNTTDTGTYGNIFSPDNFGSTRNWQFFRWNDKIRFLLRDSSGNSIYDSLATATETINDGQWHHLAATWDGTTNSNGISIYVDGDLSVQGTASSTALRNSVVTQRIGAGNTTWDFIGKISNCQLWNTNLSGPEISTLYNNGQPLMTGTQPQEANLKAWYKLDQSANWDLFGQSKWTVPDSSSPYTKSFSLDSANSPADYFNTNTGPRGMTTNVGTYSCWINLNSIAGTQVFMDVAGFASREFLNLKIRNNNALQMEMRSWSTQMLWDTVSTTPFEVGKWYHVVAVGDGTNIKMYINGDEITTYIASGSYRWWSNFNTSIAHNGGNRIYLGAGVYPTRHSPLNGRISNAQIWNTNLSSSQIETLYNNGKPLQGTQPAQTNLLAWYKLNQDSTWTNYNYWNNVLVNKWNSKNSAITTTPPTDSFGFSGVAQDGDYEGWEVTNKSISGSLLLSFWYKTTGDSVFTWTFNEDGSGNTNAGKARMQGNGYIYFFSPNASNYFYRANTNIGDYNWHNLIIYIPNGSPTYDANDINLWLDGVELGKPTIVGSTTWDAFTEIKGMNRNSSSANNGTGTQWSNWALFENVTPSDSVINTIFNDGTPGDISSLNPSIWYKLDNTDTTFATTGSKATALSITDSSSNNNNATGPYDYDAAVNSRPVIISGDVQNAIAGYYMDGSELENFGVSTLNGKSSGMNTSNLVTSTLTRQVPYNSYSIYFDGTSDYIEVPDDTSLKPTSAITCSMWFNCGTQNTNRQFLSKYYDSVDGAYGFYTNGSSTDLYFYVTVDGTTYDSPVGSGFFDDNWHHAVGVYDGANIYLYVDGAQQGTTTEITGSISYNEGILCFASLAGSPTAYEVDTYLNNISIFNEALTSTKILKLYNSGVPSDLSTFNPQPVSWWSLGSDSYYNGTNYICPDLIGTNNSNASNGLSANSLVGNAPNSSANGTSTNMTYDANLTGNAPNSSNNSFSVNMSYDDRVSGSGDVPS